MTEKIDITMWMPMVWSDYDQDTQFLSLEEHGAYFKLIGAYWKAKGVFPADINAAYKATGATTENEQKSVKNILENYFKTAHNRYRHSRIDDEIERAIKNQQSQHNRTKAATEAKKEKRRNKQRDDNVTLDVAALPLPLPLPINIKDNIYIKDEKINEDLLSEHFEKVKEEYPIQVKLEEAWTVFRTLMLSGEITFEEFMAALKNYTENKPARQEWMHLYTYIITKSYKSDYRPKEKKVAEKVQQEADKSEQEARKEFETVIATEIPSMASLRAKVRERVGGSTYNSWLASTAWMVEGTQLTIVCPNRYVSDWNKSRHQYDINEVVNPENLVVTFMAFRDYKKQKGEQGGKKEV